MQLRHPTILTYLPLVWILLSSSLQAQIDKRLSESWRWVQFTTESGLPSNEIVDVEEGGNGAIWAIAHQGVAWFDEYEWHTIPFPDSLTGGVILSSRAMISGDLFLCIASGSWGNVCVVSRSGTIASPQLTFKGSALSVSSILELRDSTFLFAASVGGVGPSSLFRLSDGKITRINFPGIPNDSTLNVNRVWMTQTNNCYVNTSSGIFRTANGQTLHTWFPRMKDYNFIGTIAENAAGKGFFVGKEDYQNKGVYVWAKNSVPTPTTFGTLNRIVAADISPSGEILIIQQSGEVHFYRSKTWFALRPVPEQLKQAHMIRFLRNGDLCVGTDKALWLLRVSTTRWRYLRFPTGDPQNNVNAICMAHDGSVWSASGNGVVRFLSDGSRTSTTRIGDLHLGVVTAVNEDHDNNIWIGSGSSFKGAMKFDGKSWTLHRGKGELEDVLIHKIQKDMRGDLWFLGIGDKYLGNDQPGAFHYLNGKFERWGKDSGLLDGRVYSFIERPQNIYWFGTREGVSRWSHEGWKYWRSFFGRAYALSIDDDGTAWISNFGLNPSAQIRSDGSILLLNKELDIQCNIVTDIRSDERSRMWLASDLGVFTYSNKTLTRFSPSSGLGTSQVICILPTKDRVYFGTLESGIAILDLTELEHQPRVTIQKPMFAGDNAIVRWNAFSFWGNTSPRDIETRYKVDHENWSSWKTDHEVTLFGLSYGKHTLTVQAKDYFGRVGEKQESVASFDIPVPFYLRDSFLWPIGISFSTAIVLFILYLQRRKKFDRELQRHRDRIAQDLHDEIGSNLGTISLISQRLEREKGMSSSNKHELADITATAMQTADTLREIVWYVNPHHDSIETMILHLREISSRMLRDVECSFDAGGLSTGISIDLETRRSIYMMFKETLHNIVKHSRAKHVHIAIVQTTGEIQIQVHDDGIGFDTLTSHPGFGLQNLQKRCENLGGTMHIESMVGKGTTIYLRTKIT